MELPLGVSELRRIAEVIVRKPPSKRWVYRFRNRHPADLFPSRGPLACPERVDWPSNSGGNVSALDILRSRQVKKSRPFVGSSIEHVERRLRIDCNPAAGINLVEN